MDLNSVNQYLKGDLFSGGLVVKIAEKEKDVLYRIPFLKSLVENKKVIHLGCVDHVALVEDKINTDNWLHKILYDSSQQCIGVDINKQGIDYLTDMGVKDVYYLDIINDERPLYLANQHWDYLILGEVLEHIDNPVSFLSALRQKYQDIVDNFVITVPNAYTYSNLLSLFHNVEKINSDHRYWFTPYTLGKVCANSGYTIHSFYFARKSMINSIFPFKKLLFKSFPVLRDTIIMIIKP